MDLFSWPECPPAPRAEQRELPLAGTITQRYADWRATPDGQEVWRWIESAVLSDVRHGVTRLSAKALLERARGALRIKANNDFTPELAREMQERHPATRGLFRDRQRRAA